MGVSVMGSEGLTEHEALLVEDDIQEVESVLGVCQSVHVSACKGMTSVEINRIRQMAALAVQPDVQQARKLPTANPAKAAGEATGVSKTRTESQTSKASTGGRSKTVGEHNAVQTISSR